MPQDILVTLKNGSQELSSFVVVAMMRLENLIKEQPILFYELVSICRDREHVLFGNAGQALKEMDLLQSNFLPHDSLRNVVLSAVVGDGRDMKLTSPIKHESNDQAAKMNCPICGKEYSQTRPTKWGGMEYIHAGDPANVVCQQSSASYKLSQQ